VAERILLIAATASLVIAAADRATLFRSHYSRHDIGVLAALCRREQQLSCRQATQCPKFDVLLVHLVYGITHVTS
jgi:hypothetical protein